MEMEQSREKTGLVLEGGGMRGIYTAGVLDVFLEHHICVDGVIGVSAGAIHGCSFVAGQTGRSIRYYKTYCKDKRFMSFYNFLRTGDMVDEQFCYHELPEVLDPYDYEAFERSGIKYYVTCSNVDTGKAEYLQITDMKRQIDLLRASASLPYVSRLVEYEGKRLLDGGCTDSIPVNAFMKMGYGKNVVAEKLRQGAGIWRIGRDLLPKVPPICKSPEKPPQNVQQYEKADPQAGGGEPGLCHKPWGGSGYGARLPRPGKDPEGLRYRAAGRRQAAGESGGVSG